VTGVKRVVAKFGFMLITTLAMAVSAAAPVSPEYSIVLSLLTIFGDG